VLIELIVEPVSSVDSVLDVDWPSCNCECGISGLGTTGKLNASDAESY
jgi:hypothetical protein